MPHPCRRCCGRISGEEIPVAIAVGRMGRDPAAFNPNLAVVDPAVWSPPFAASDRTAAGLVIRIEKWSGTSQLSGQPFHDIRLGGRVSVGDVKEFNGFPTVVAIPGKGCPDGGAGIIKVQEVEEGVATSGEFLHPFPELVQDVVAPGAIEASEPEDGALGEGGIFPDQPLGLKQYLPGLGSSFRGCGFINKLAIHLRVYGGAPCIDEGGGVVAAGPGKDRAITFHVGEAVSFDPAAGRTHAVDHKVLLTGKLAVPCGFVQLCGKGMMDPEITKFFRGYLISGEGADMHPVAECLFRQAYTEPACAEDGDVFPLQMVLRHVHGLPDLSAAYG